MEGCVSCSWRIGCLLDLDVAEYDFGVDAFFGHRITPFPLRVECIIPRITIRFILANARPHLNN